MMDLHIHTNFSDGEADYKTVIDLAINKNIDVIAITDHFDPMDHEQSNYGVNEDDLERYFKKIRAYAEGKNIAVLCGVETGGDSEGCAHLSERVKELCDIVITSPHYFDYNGHIVPGNYYNDGYWEAYKERVLKIAAGEGDVLGHQEAYLPRKRLLPLGKKFTFEEGLKFCLDIADRYFDEAFVEAVGMNLLKSCKACELHGGSGSPREWVVKKYAEMGVVFSVGSDAHLTSFIGRTARAYELVKKYDLKLIEPCTGRRLHA